MAPKFQIKVFQLSKFVKNFTIISVVTLSFLLVFFSKTDYYFINGIKNVSSSIIVPITRFISAPVNTLSNFVDEYEVQTNTVDNVFKDVNLEKTLLKIDVEGFEMNVIKGSKIKLKEIPYILIENQFGNHYKNSNFENLTLFIIHFIIPIVFSMYFCCG